MEQDLIKCPKCQSTQVTANKKGFSGAKAVGGVLLTGGVGLLAGTIGSNKVIITCLACGHEFKAGEDLVHGRRNKRLKRDEQMKVMKSPLYWVVLAVFFIIIIRACN